MSDRLQFEFHPDADQISAFVEHALPAHERERVLDHLAVCPECRAVVAFSLPTVEEPGKSMPTPARKPWWAQWMVAWPAVAALAATMLLVMYFHKSANTPNASEPPQTASVNPPSPPISQVQSAMPSAAPAPRGPGAQLAGNSRAVSATGAAVAANQRNEMVVSSQSVAALPMAGRNITPSVAMAVPSPVASPASAGQQPATGAGAAGSLGAGVVGSNPNAPSADAEAGRQQPVSVAAAAIASAPSASSAAAMASPASTTETVVVTNAAPMPTVSADLSNVAIAETEVGGALLKHALPSHQPVLSMATQANRIVAIDTRNAVFLSKDGGKHWTAVPVQWPGRAVKADLVVYSAGNAARYQRDKAASLAALPAGNAMSVGDSGGALAAQGQSLKEQPGSSLSGTVTDPSGAVIPKTSVSVTEAAAQTVRTVKTDGSGRYHVDGLAPGTYKVEAQAPGFKGQVLAAVTITAAQPAVQNISLEVGAASQTVTVEAASSEIAEPAKKVAKPAAASPTLPVFEITTDRGEHWTSTNGATWTLN